MRCKAYAFTPPGPSSKCIKISNIKEVSLSILTIDFFIKIIYNKYVRKRERKIKND